MRNYPHVKDSSDSPVSVTFAVLLATSLVADLLTHLLLQVQVGLEPMKTVAHTHTFYKMWKRSAEFQNYVSLQEFKIISLLQ